MGKFFNLDSPIMRALSKMADLMWLNLLTLVMCIPIVTAGAAFTALHYVCLKMARDEEGYVTKDFFKSFKENFRQATVIWIFVLIVGFLLIYDFVYVVYGQDANFGSIFTALLIASTFLFMCVCSLVFPVLSHFVNSIKRTLKNSFLISILILPKTVLMIILYAIPPLLFYAGISIKGFSGVVPMTWVFWFSAPAYLSAKLYSKSFKRFEPHDEEAQLTDDFDFRIEDSISEGGYSDENIPDSNPEDENEG